MELDTHKIMKVNTHFKPSTRTWEVRCNVFGEIITKSCRDQDEVFNVQHEIEEKAKEYYN